MSGPTAGPWELGEDTRGRERVFAGQYEIVRALSTHGPRRLSKAERHANARLIAASLALLEALEECIAFMDSIEGHGYGATADFECPRKMGRDAIKQARGREGADG